ncbi:MAG: SpoIID/LytB domain-containing protein [Deltaproteobacteria bacterium]|nr:SpoIID/LytB domain-containing protein [Deltaproteobacteria bacterium]
MTAPLLLAALLAQAGLVEDLYSHRLLFDERGRPLVPIGMMQNAARVVVVGEHGLLVTAGEAPPVEVTPGVPLVVERVSGTAAVVRPLWVIETLEAEARQQKRAAADVWAGRGLAAQILDVGGVYGVKGTVVDNRAALVVLPSVGDRLDDKTARALAAVGARESTVEALDALPSVQLRVLGATAAFVRVVGKDGRPVLVKEVEHGVGYADHGFADRLLRGELLVVPDKGGRVAVVNLVDEDAVVAGVLPSEMFASAPLEALKAQAVTARGELFAKIGRRHLADPFQVCSEQHCQVYKGVSAEHPRATQAADETRGELAFVGERLVESVYSACCGGHTEAADVVWDRPPQSALAGRADVPFADPASRPWLAPDVEASALAARARHDRKAPPVPIDLRTDAAVEALLAAPKDATWCGRSSFNQKGDVYRWTRRFTRVELDAAFADLGVGEVRRLAVEERGPGGRLRALVIEGNKGRGRVLRELPVRKRLANLRSGLFVIDEERDAAGALLAVTLRGAGFGHGSGMCQQGAIGMAEGGADYRAILRHYYVGAAVKRVF